MELVDVPIDKLSADVLSSSTTTMAAASSKPARFVDALLVDVEGVVSVVVGVGVVVVADFVVGVIRAAPGLPTGMPSRAPLSHSL
jgi:hypothetical protein